MSTDRHVPYRPTSLEYINRPNPVEPHAVPEKHPLNGAPRLEKTSKEEFLRLLLGNNVEPPAKRRKSGDSKLPDLPRLPAVRNGTKRLRIPPTLSGLHHPPPDAGLLPSMSVEHPLRLPENATKGPSVEDNNSPAESATATSPKHSEGSTTRTKASASKRKHNRWTEDETSCLLQGVAQFGIGQWTKILNCPDYQFDGRTALDLKDRFRVCYPDIYKASKKANATRTAEDSTNGSRGDSSNVSKRKNRARVKLSDNMTPNQLEKIGIDKPFEKSKRRKRTGYTEEEDVALLRGFEKHGNAWAAIRTEEEILKDRTATDLRDRFRTRYPDQYARAGLAPRPEQFPKKARGDGQAEQDAKKDVDVADGSHTTLMASNPTERPTEKENRMPNAAVPKKPQPISLIQNNDVFWGAPFEPDDADSEPITLDRGILDWAYDLTRGPTANDNTANIDPLATLNLPRPTATKSGVGPVPTASALPPNLASSSSNALPSVATITAGFWQTGSEGVEEHLELPSLLGDFGGLESDTRTGGHFMSMEELLS